MKAVIKLISSLFTRLLSDSYVEKRYIKAGRIFGDMVSYIPIAGECIGFKSYFKKWKYWEEIYLSRGFRTHHIDDFIELGGFEKPISNRLKPLEHDEIPILHSHIYEKYFLGKIPRSIDISSIFKGEVDFVEGVGILPSTKE